MSDPDQAPSRLVQLRDDAPIVALAVAAWTGASLARPVATPVLVAVGLGAVVADRLLARRRPSSAGRRVALVGLTLAALTSGLAARALDGLHLPQEGPVEATVALVSDPEPTATGRIRVDVRLDGRRLLAEARTPAAKNALEPRLAGDRVHVRGQLEPFEPRRPWADARHLAGRLRVEAVLGTGGGAPHAAVANGLRRTLDRGAASLPERHRALLAGLTLGDDRAQPAELSADFRASGLTHLLAVSGSNVAFVLVVCGPLLRRLRIWPRFVVAVAVVVGFAFLTRFEPSVVRASFVAAVALWARTTGRPSGGMRHLALAVCALLVVDPLLTRSVGFRLSVAACVGILVLGPHLVERLPGPRWAREALGTTTAAQLGVAPVLIPAFGAMPLAALPANVAAAPLAAGLMVWGVTGGLVAGAIGGPAAQLLHLPSSAGLAALELVASASASVPFGQVDLRHVVLAAAAGAVAVLGRRWWRLLAVGLVAVALTAPGLTGVPAGSADAGWAATVWSDGPVAVIDLRTGASAVEVIDVLRRRRVRTVALVVVRTGRPELAAVVGAIRSRFPVTAVVAPPGAPVDDHAVPPPGTVTRVGDLEIQIGSTRPDLDVRIGWRNDEDGRGRG